MRYLLIPGIHGSGAEHWQTLWERELGDACVRLAPRSWDEPDEEDWIAAVGRGVDALTGRNATAAEGVPADRGVLVAHSLGCLAAASRLTREPDDERIAGAFFVAPPDREAPSVPAAAAAFACPARALPVPAVVVASEDDPYATLPRIRRMADGWAAPLIDVGAHGHLNEDSRLGAWATGRGLLTAFVAGLGG